jgi:hypothetical protein
MPINGLSPHLEMIADLALPDKAFAPFVRSDGNRQQDAYSIAT